MQLLKALELFIAPLEKNGIAYFITGSTASIYYGEPRLTLDIDVVVHLNNSDVEKFPSLFNENDFYCPPVEVIQIECNRSSHGHFNLIHPETASKADIYPASGDPLHAWALQNRRREDAGNGLQIWLAPPEYIIIRKLEYYREGGSEKHIQDIGKMLPQVKTQLNWAFLKKELEARALTRYWDHFPTHTLPSS